MISVYKSILSEEIDLNDVPQSAIDALNNAESVEDGIKKSNEILLKHALDTAPTNTTNSSEKHSELLRTIGRGLPIAALLGILGYATYNMIKNRKGKK